MVFNSKTLENHVNLKTDQGESDKRFGGVSEEKQWVEVYFLANILTIECKAKNIIPEMSQVWK